MPKFKKVTISCSHPKMGTLQSITIDVNISADGFFYAQVPEELRMGLGDAGLSYDPTKSLPGKAKVSANTFEALECGLNKALQTICDPKVTVEHVIRYNIESHVTFATDMDGNVFPNSGYPGAAWRGRKADKAYGNHYAQNPSIGGYSLTLGAHAYTKRVFHYGTRQIIEYSHYYGEGGDHLGNKTPAEQLNGWVGLYLPEDCKEIPYSDEAALFFHSLMMSMATLSKRIQESTFDQDKLLQLIANNGNPMLPAPRVADEVGA